MLPLRCCGRQAIRLRSTTGALLVYLCLLGLVWADRFAGGMGGRPGVFQAGRRSRGFPCDPGGESFPLSFLGGHFALVLKKVLKRVFLSRCEKHTFHSALTVQLTLNQYTTPRCLTKNRENPNFSFAKDKSRI